MIHWIINYSYPFIIPLTIIILIDISFDVDVDFNDDVDIRYLHFDFQDVIS